MMFKKFLSSFLTLTLLTLAILVTGPPTPAKASTAVIDSYIKVNSVSRFSDGSMILNYTLLKEFKNDLGNNVYQWMSLETYMAGNPNIFIQWGTPNKPGTYSRLFEPLASWSGEGRYIGTQVLKIGYGTTSYGETKTVGRYFNAPPPSETTVSYHELTREEAVAGWAWQFIVPGILVKLNPTSRLIQIAASASAGWSLISGFTGSAGYSTGLPQPVAGHYYKHTGWFDDFKFYTKVEVWYSKAAFDHGDLPIYTGTSYVDMP
ncbi:hypothetical protein T458_05335 [Brevibacillus panacihumi W25]|uniref:Uncharacterized protein n=1 Tax=Brevibacillus panacihumi W25 TaxID=1408254 RepID=V6MB38_9BACL|nr:hypothetical protein [Brevibacillus panacihumi]EST55754.1 hypothetical protein T458_05335 [Brevibacillus panacihumi W25]